jgi:hypothetical protein
MDINDKSKMIPILDWLKEQPEMKANPITDENSIFYHVAPLKYVELIYRYVREEELKTSKEALNLASIKDWLPLPTRKDIWDDYNIAAENNCYLKFDDGSVCRYNDEQWPMAITTHYAHA